MRYKSSTARVPIDHLLKDNNKNLEKINILSLAIEKVREKYPDATVRCNLSKDANDFNVNTIEICEFNAKFKDLSNKNYDISSSCYDLYVSFYDIIPIEMNNQKFDVKVFNTPKTKQLVRSEWNSSTHSSNVVATWFSNKIKNNETFEKDLIKALINHIDDLQKKYNIIVDIDRMPKRVKDLIKLL